jgi:nucleoside-diphosphate-sugar epimerase
VKRVLLTGAGGFIGRHAATALAAKGHEVHAVWAHRQPAAGAVHGWHRADLLDPAAVRELLAQVRPTHLLHFAWYAEPGKYWQSPENFRWLDASLVLLRAFRENGGERAVMAGTCAEYDWQQGLCVENATPRRPATPYGACKNSLQEAMAKYCEAEGLSCAWGRIFFLYGPGEHPSRLVPSVVNALLDGDFARCTHGNQVRDYLHVEDVAAAFVALLESDVRGAVNIASGRPVTLRDVVLAAAERLHAAERVRFGALAAPDNEPPLLVADVGRLEREVGWRPRYDLASGIESTVRYWQEKRAA